MFKSTLAVSMVVALVVLTFLGCEREPAPLPPLSAEQLPGEMQKAFSNAKPEVKNLVTALLSALASKDYTGAYQAVQLLCNEQGTTKEQRTLAARASLTVHGLLQTAQAQGDANAAATLKQHLRDK